VEPTAGAPVPDPAGEPGRDQSAGPPADAAARERRWWQRLPFLVAVGVLPVPFGLFFLAFVAIALLLGDSTRETETRAGGAVLLFWWAYSFREGDTTPYVGGILLAISAVLFVRGALKRRRAGGRFAWVPALGAVLAVALGVVSFVPYGYRQPELTRADAVRRTLAERRAHPWRGIDARRYLVERGRLRIVHTPVWYVALYEPNPDVAATADGQPCFRRREVWQVNAIDGSVSHTTYDEARVLDDPCLPIRLGTEQDLRPVPA
jgi:hypothetical protein